MDLNEKFKNKTGLINFPKELAVLEPAMFCGDPVIHGPKFDKFSQNIRTQLINYKDDIENKIYYDYLVFLNKNSGKYISDSQKLKIEVIKILKKKHNSLQCGLEIFEGDQNDFINKIFNFKYYNKNQVILVLGGDGTIQNIIDSIYKRRIAFKHYEILNVFYIPCGTGNDLYASYGGDVSSYENKLNFIKRVINRTIRNRPIDVGYLKYRDSSNNKQEKAFTGQFGIGICAECSLNSNNFSLIGKLKYEVSGVIEILKMKKYKAKEILADGEVILKNIEFDLIQVNNIQCSGGGMQMAPIAQVDDGLLDLIIIQTTNQKQLLDLFMALKKNGAHIFMSQYVKYYRAKKVQINFEEELIYNFEVDGEVDQLQHKVEIGIINDLIQIPYPNEKY